MQQRLERRNRTCLLGRGGNHEILGSRIGVEKTSREESEHRGADRPNVRARVDLPRVAPRLLG